MNINELVEETSAPVRAAMGALEVKLVMLELKLSEAIEQHEAFRQEVSDAVADYFQNEGDAACKRLCGFIIPKPKPDPLVEVLAEVDIGNGWDDEEDYARQIHKALEARGLEIRSKNSD